MGSQPWRVPPGTWQGREPWFLFRDHPGTGVKGWGPHSEMMVLYQPRARMRRGLGIQSWMVVVRNQERGGKERPEVFMGGPYLSGDDGLGCLVTRRRRDKTWDLGLPPG